MGKTLPACPGCNRSSSDDPRQPYNPALASYAENSGGVVPPVAMLSFAPKAFGFILTVAWEAGDCLFVSGILSSRQLLCPLVIGE